MKNYVKEPYKSVFDTEEKQATDEQVSSEQQKDVQVDYTKQQYKSIFGEDREEGIETKVEEQSADPVVQDDKEEVKEQDEKSDDEKAMEAIKWLIENDWGKDDNSQGQAAQMFKGLSFSQSDKANAFMDEVNKFTTGLKDKYLK